MTVVQPSSAERARSLAKTRQEGFGLNRACYVDEDLFRIEMDEIWRKGWLFVGHSCDAPLAGDYFAYEIDGDPIVLVRQNDGSIKALHNVCRHRGSIVLVEEHGHHPRLMCPYHQWIYDLDGSLLRCQGAPEGFSREDNGLRPIATEEIAGLVFICLGESPPPIEEARQLMSRAGDIQGLVDAKVAMSIDYEVQANWKLIWENNRECFHCDANHPQYVKANFDHFDPGDTRQQVAFDTALERQRLGLAESGIAIDLYDEFGLSEFPDPTGKQWWTVNRTAMEAGFHTESIDGELVAPIMGGYSNSEVGTLRIRSMPNFWCHASCDHVVSTRITPIDRSRTHLRVSWLVDAQAEEGRDYDLTKLMPFWQLTSEQDWTICERQQRGVSSSAFRPGPLAVRKEPNVERFLSWYVTSISNGTL